MPTVDLDMGRIHYEEAGPPDGRPVVCINGFVMGGNLWDGLRSRLAARGLRCITPTWPVGAHPEPMRPGADLTPRGHARGIAQLLERLHVEDVVLVGNDSGGALCQITAAHHPERIGALVLTNCDTFEHFPPSFFKALLPAARVAATFKAALAPLKTAAVRRSPVGFGLLAHADVDHLAKDWVRPMFEVDGVLDDARRFVASLDGAVTIDAARRLADFPHPIVLAWGEDDKLFPPAHAERFAREVPAARHVRIPGSRTFVMIDQPDRLAEVVAEVAGAVPVAAS